MFPFDDESGAGVGLKGREVVPVHAQFDGLMSGMACVIQDMAEQLLSESTPMPVGMEVELVQVEPGAVGAG